MSRFRILFFSALVCLPAILLIVSGTVWIVMNVPAAIKSEPRRIGLEYREVAEDIAESPLPSDGIGGRRKGWRQAGKVNGAPWGYAVEGEETTVWVKTGQKEWRSRKVAVLRPFPYVAVFYAGGALAALLLIAVSAFAVSCMVRFLRERDDFLRATAHDLTTPLVGLRMTIGRSDDEARRLVDRLLLIVGNLRDFMRLGGRRKPECRSADVVALVKEAYCLFASDYEEETSGAVEFGDGFAAADVPCVMIDETVVLQILWNLFGNDLKYAAPFGPVTVRLTTDARFVTVEFADSGSGMSPQEMRKAFNRYYRAKTALQSGKGGFGIGLCTAREFARAMGGDLAVRANEPTGCVFALSLPRADLV